MREEERSLKRFGCKDDVGGPQGNATSGPHPTLVPGAFLHPAAPAPSFSLCTLLSPSPALHGLFPACLPACLPSSNLTRSRPFLQICSIHWPWCTSPLGARSHSGPRGVHGAAASPPASSWCDLRALRPGVAIKVAPTAAASSVDVSGRRHRAPRSEPGGWRRWGRWRGAWLVGAGGVGEKDARELLGRLARARRAGGTSSGLTVRLNWVKSKLNTEALGAN